MWAVIFKPWEDEPVYHRSAPEHSTACGRSRGPGTPMWPFKHAKRIGRPCKGCFPSE
jgi:hypothetical protein